MIKTQIFQYLINLFRYKNKCCYALAKSLNLGYPEHKCFVESSELRMNSQRFLSKGNMATVVQRLNITAPVVEKGNQVKIKNK